MATTNITKNMSDAFQALVSGDYDNFALFSCFVNDEPACAIVAVSVQPPPETKADPLYHFTPLFVSVTPTMRLTDHDGVTP